MTLAALPPPSPTGDVLMAFLSILFEGAPYILVGTIVSGFIDAFLPAKLLDRVLPRNKVLSTILSGFLGLIFPVCECAVVPVVRRLVGKGLPISCAITYLLSAPIINPIVIFSTLNAFKIIDTTEGSLSGWSMTVARISLGFTVAVLVGLCLLRKKPVDILRPEIAAAMNAAPPPETAGETAPRASFNARLVQAMRTAKDDFLDTAMYFAIGVAITSYFNTQIDQSLIEQVAGSDWKAVPSLMGLAFILALCSTSDAFIAAPMAAFSSAAKLAFLVFGPMLDVKLVFMYSSLFNRKFVIGLALAMFALVASLSVPWVNMIKMVFAMF